MSNHDGNSVVQQPARPVREATPSEPERGIHRYLGIAWPVIAPAALVIAVVIFSTFFSAGIQNTTNLMLINLILVIGLYTFSGNSGVLSFGHISFMGMGAYACALLTIPVTLKESQLNLPGFLEGAILPTVPAILVAAVFVALIAYLIAIPLMRLSGLSAGIATLSLLVITNVVISHWDDVTKGQLTLVGTPTDTTLWGSVVWVLAVMTIAYLYQKSKSGLRLRASREEPHAALSVGVNITADRRRAFALSAGMMAVAGGLYGHLLGTFGANSFYFDLTFITFAMLVIGGITSFSGAVVGTIVVSIIAEVFRQFESGISLGSLSISLPNGSQEIVLAILLLVILIFRPNGVMSGREFAYPFARTGSGGRRDRKQEAAAP